MLHPADSGSVDDLLARAGRLAVSLAQTLETGGAADTDLPALVEEHAAAETEVRDARLDVERHEARLDEAAVHAAETMVTLRNAVDGLKDNRTQLVEGGLADEAMLGDLDFQIGTLETRIAEVKATQTSENRTIEHDLSPERDRLVAAELRRQTATAQLIRRVLALKPAPCPPTLLHDYDTLERLRRELPDV